MLTISSNVLCRPEAKRMRDDIGIYDGDLLVDISGSRLNDTNVRSIVARGLVGDHLCYYNFGVFGWLGGLLGGWGDLGETLVNIGGFRARGIPRVFGLMILGVMWEGVAPPKIPQTFNIAFFQLQMLP